MSEGLGEFTFAFHTSEYVLCCLLVCLKKRAHIPVLLLSK